MFTGLICDLGTVQDVCRESLGASLRIATTLAGEIADGDSVAVNGVCLTATSVRDGGFSAQAMLETLRRSSLGRLRGGERVNLELPLRAGDRLGGHFVQGHVDGVGTVRGVAEDGFARVLDVQCAPELARYMAEKGSVALDGVSLTVSGVERDGLRVSLIPETQQRTNLGTIGEGDVVNIEVDMLAKHIERLIGGRA